MKKALIFASAIAAFSLSACGGQGDDALAEQVEDRADAKADAMEAKADQLEDAADDLEERADAVRERGEDRADAIDAADPDVDAMSPAERQAIIDNEKAAVR